MDFPQRIWSVILAACSENMPGLAEASILTYLDIKFELFLLPDSLQQPREVERRGSHLTLHHLEASLIERGLYIRLSMQVCPGGLHFIQRFVIE